MRSAGISSNAATVLVIGVDARAMGLVREALGAEAALPSGVTPYEDALAMMRKMRPEMVLVGFDSDFEEAIRIGSAIHQESNRTVLVAIAARSDNSRLRAAMRAGYREFVVLPDDAELLRQALHEATFREGAGDDGGEVIALWGSKGGVGTTLLGVNLAGELSPVHRVCLVDFDFAMGDAAAFLDLTPSQSVHDLFRNLHRLDERMLAGHVAVHPSKIHVLAQPAELASREEVQPEGVMRVLTAVARAYQYCIVDCGNSLDSAAMTAATVADHILLVATHDVPGIKNTWRRLQLIETMGIEKERVHVILNRFDRRNTALPMSVIEDNLRRKVDIIISEDRLAAKAVNDGRLLRELDRKAQITKDVEAMVALLTDGEVQEEKKSGSVMGWLFRF
ncbi:MAG TPA: AAA family ATPase [Myxococcota bacterium]|nr:AAA family ATPase [Myxococcota bacterium]